MLIFWNGECIYFKTERNGESTFLKLLSYFYRSELTKDVNNFQIVKQREKMVYIFPASFSACTTNVHISQSYISV